MNFAMIGGLGLMMIGGILFSGEKSLGIHNPPMGVLLIGGGFMLALYGYYDGSTEENSVPRRRRATDNFV
jgi:hypothetical protein